MELKPIILGLIFIFMLYFLFNTPSDGGGKGKHDAHGGKGGSKDKKHH